MIEIYPRAGVSVHPLTAIAAQERPAPGGRPYVLTNMVSSADGATAVSGLSGDLAGPADAEVFRALRAVADVIIAGASTVREERYRAPQTAPSTQEIRVSRGQEPKPKIAVVTASGNLDPDLPLFDDSSYVPLVLTGDGASEERLAALDGKATVIRCGAPGGGVDLVRGLEILHQTHGCSSALLEGGPSLNGQFLALDLIDEWNLTLSNLLVGGDAKRAAQGTQATPRGMQLRRVWTKDDLLFCSWQR